MKSKRLKRGLRRIVGAKAVLDDPGSLAAYAYDSSLQTATPDVVLFPRKTEHVAQILSLLDEEGVPFVARGAGTNLSGGSIPLKGGAVIAFGRMKRILGIDTENFVARVEPGLTNMALQEILAGRGFFFAPDPASQKVSTLGGNFAENSGGPHCLKYGVTTNHILGATLVMPRGEIIALGGETLDSPDSGLLGLLVGSEGTMGIVTELICRVMPLPESVETMLAIFDSTEQAGRAVSDIIAAGIVPATLEMMDNMIIRAVEQSLQAGYPTDAAAVLIIEIDGPREGLGETAAEIADICRRNEAREVRTAANESEREQLWAGRRGAFGAVASIHPNYSVSDGTVPRTRLADVLRSVDEIGRKYNLEIGNVFHAGDGNLHPLIFFDYRDKDQLKRVHLAGEEILEACIEAGGTITGEHGIGTEKIKAMPQFFGPDEIKLMRRIKTALDPAGLCNPGKILPEPESNAERLDGNAAARSASTRGNVAESRKYSPETPEELATVVSELAASGKSFAPIGAGTLYSRLAIREQPHALIETRHLRKIVEHDAANLTVTALAGLSIGELQETLERAGQFLPLDAPAEATLGGLISGALPGPRRHIHGAVRDLALGLRFVGADGTNYRSGGKTVKNVAGYDFGKLLTGAWGTLGIITEATFRLLPLPKACGAILAGFDKAKYARAAASEITGSRLNPALATILNSTASTQLSDEVGILLSPARFHLAFGAEGSALSVERQLTEFERICGERGAQDLSKADHEDYRRFVAAINRLSYGVGLPEPLLSFVANARCRDTVGVAKLMEELAGNEGDPPLVLAHAAAGAVYAHISPPQDAPGFARRLINSIAMRFPHMSITVLGSGDNSYIDRSFVVGNGGVRPWRKAIRTCFDPKGLLNPGMPEW